MGDFGITGLALGDGLANFVSRLGTPADKTFHDIYTYTLPIDTEAAYRTSWFRKIVDIPPFDEVREWRTWSGADEDQVKKITAEEDRLGLRQKLAEARTLARKDGGSAIVMSVGGGNLSGELKPDAIGAGGLKFITVCTRNDIQPGEREDDPSKENYGRPKNFRLRDPQGTEVHPSRVIQFIGNPIRMLGYWDGWGESLWVELRTAVKNADRIAAAIAALTDEAKLDVVSIDGLMSNLATAEYEGLLTRRWQLMGTFKSLMNALLLDKNDEYTQKTLTFAGLPDIQDRALMVMSGMADIPATRLLGRSPQGMNATGESDMRNYYDRIKSGQEMFLRPALYPLDEMIIRSALGSRPDEVYYEWNPLYQMSEKEAAEVEKIFAETVEKYVNTATIPDVVLAAIVRDGIIERGQFPGAETAYDEADEAGEIAGIEEEPTEAEKAAEEAAVAVAKAQAADPAGFGAKPKRLVAANDAVLADARPRSLYIRRDVVNQADIKAWAKAQGFKSTVDDMHVTIARSSVHVDWIAIGQEWSWTESDSGNLTIPPGGPRVVEELGTVKRAAVLMFASTSLAWRHRAIRDAGASWDFPDYQPHITITYEPGSVDLEKVAPYRGKIVLGPEIFEEIKPVGTIEHEES